MKPKVSTLELKISPIPGLSFEQYKTLFVQVNDQPKLEVNMECKLNFISLWVIEFEATKNVSCNNSMMRSLKETTDGIPISIPNGDSVAVKGVGSVELPNNLDVINVLYIPDFKCNS